MATNNITSTEVATGKVAKVAAVTESMSLIDKKLYTLQEVCDFRHSRTYADLKDGVMLLKLFRSLDLIMVRCWIKRKIEEAEKFTLES